MMSCAIRTDEWACSPLKVASVGSMVDSSSVIYELFVMQDDEGIGNWLSGCGMYADGSSREKATRIQVPAGDTSYSLRVDAKSNIKYR